MLASSEARATVQEEREHEPGGGGRLCGGRSGRTSTAALGQERVQQQEEECRKQEPLKARCLGFTAEARARLRAQRGERGLDPRRLVGLAGLDESAGRRVRGCLEYLG